MAPVRTAWSAPIGTRGSAQPLTLTAQAARHWCTRAGPIGDAALALTASTVRTQNVSENATELEPGKRQQRRQPVLAHVPPYGHHSDGTPKTRTPAKGAYRGGNAGSNA